MANKKVSNLALIILIIIVTSSFIANFSPVEAQKVIRQDVLVNVRPIAPIDTNLTPNDFKFESTYALTLVYSKSQSPKELIIPEKTFRFAHINSTIKEYSIIDNLGNEFQPYDENGLLTNNEIKVNLPNNFEYKVTLHLIDQTGIYFDGTEYVISNYNLNADNFTITFPTNYTIRETSPNAPQEIIGNNIVLKWAKPSAITIKFVPFSVQFTTRTMKTTVDVSSVFPNKGQLAYYMEKTFTTPSQFSVWNITPYTCIFYNIPTYLEKLQVVKVWDGVGECHEIGYHVEKATAKEAGTYFMDYTEKVIYIYPRFSYVNEFYQYKIGYELINSADISGGTMISQNSLLPYRYETGVVMPRTDPADDWSTLNLTENIVKIVLPQGAEIQYEESEKPLIGIENGRPTATYVLSTSINRSFVYTWTAVYDMIPMRLYFLISMGFMIAFVCLIITSIIWFAKHSNDRELKRRNRQLTVVMGITTLFLGQTIANFVALGGFSNFVISIFVINLTLWLLFIMIFMFSDKAFNRLFKLKFRKNKATNPKRAK